MLNWVVIGFSVIELGTMCWILYTLRAHRKYIGSLHSDASRPRITPELIPVWKKEILKYTPESQQHRAYRAALKNAGEWDGD
jgi:hypothetical protein